MDAIHPILGSAAEEVVRVARCPVMVVKAPAPAMGPPIPELEQTTGA